MSFIVASQGRWLEAIERRISVTSQMLGGIKGVKMCGLTDVLKNRIQTMRESELDISGTFRRLLIWNMGIGESLPRDRFHHPASSQEAAVPSRNCLQSRNDLTDNIVTNL